MKDFTWNAGGTWQGRAWTPDLPTDAALLFYLFAAFLEAPRYAAKHSGCELFNLRPAVSMCQNRWSCHILIACIRVKAARNMLFVSSVSLSPMLSLLMTG